MSTMSWRRGVTLLSMLWLVLSTTATPVRRSPGGLEARRRSAIDRNMIRFGRSYPPELTAADIREAFQRPTRRQNNFLRFGRGPGVAITTDDLISLIKSYNEDDYDAPASKRAMDFIRLGRDPKFIRLGRSVDDEKTNGFETNAESSVNLNQQRKARARDHFLRLGRDSEELNEGQSEIEEQDLMEESRKKRSTTAACQDCQS